MTFDQIMADLKKKAYQPVYFLSGEETYYIDAISNYIAQNALDEAERDFNQVILYGRETDPGTIIEHAKRFPMMASHQVVIVKEAQSIRKIEALDVYLENPTPSTILVICYKYKKLDKRKAFTKLVAKNAAFLETKKMYDYQIPDWISQYLRSKKYKIQPRAALLLTDHLGTDLSKITNELEKLFISVPEGSEINADHIEKNIGISKEYNTFELQDAIGKHDFVKANQIALAFANNPKSYPLVVTLSTLYSFFAKVLSYHFLKDRSERNVASVLKIHPFFVKVYTQAAGHYNAKRSVAIISNLRDYDLRSKGVNNVSATDGELLKELLFKIFHG